jgi:hypothetical protein
MCRPLDLKNNRFGLLTAISKHKFKSKFGHTQWICKCDCGNTVIVDVCHLRSKNTKSCGCWNLKSLIKRSTKHGMAKRGNFSRVYNSWRGMLQRCENSKSTYFKNYGGRGIKVCFEWHNADKFIKWSLSHGYQDNLTIDRYPNNDGNYEPPNCRWTTYKEQAKNKRHKTGGGYHLQAS